MYSKLHETFWSDLKRKGVSTEGKLLFIYLISSPHHNMIGLYYIPLAYAAADLSWDQDTVWKGLGELSEKGFISYDQEAEMVLVRNYLRYNKLDNANVEKAAVSTATKLPETPLFQELGTVLEGLEGLYPRLRETVSERYADTITITTTMTKAITTPAAPLVRAEGAPDDEGLAAVMSAYLDRVNPTPSPRSLDELKGYVARLGPEVCLRAIDKALDAGKARWDYIRGILRRLEGDGIRSLAQWEQQEAERERQKQGAQGGPPGGSGGRASFAELAERLRKEGQS